MLDDLFDKLKTFGSKINQLEHNVSDERRKFVEIFEKNLALEKEISDRTDELNQANKSILTLKHIWSTMNSSEPLSGVLNTVVKGLAQEMEYLHSFIFQIYNDSEGKYIKVRAKTENNFGKKMETLMGQPIDNIKIPYDKNPCTIIQAIEDRKMVFSKNFKDIFGECQPFLDPEAAESIDKLFSNRSITILPIIGHEDPFGALIIVSARKEVSDIEKNFLSLFAGQIELAITIAGLFETIREQALTDSLTGIYNRRHFNKCITKEAERALRQKQPFTLITLDLDHLKIINDTYGHGAGDAAICTIASVLKQNARSIDIPARFGGEEFGILLPGIDTEGGLIAAERLRSAIEEKPVEGVGKVTASIGVATFLKHTEDVNELLDLVDKAMYKAKRCGRNQVQLADSGDTENWQKLAIETFIDVLAKQKIPVEKNITKNLVKKLNDISSDSDDINNLLFSVVEFLTKTYNPMYPEGQIQEKILLAEKLAEAIDLPQSEIDKIKHALLLYDIGNIMMPENILLKPGPLTEEERNKVSEHPIIAAREILKPISSAHSILSLVEHHHEYWDGTGYPNNLSGEKIPLGSRIIVIIDTYFALISDRPYRKAVSKKEALKIIQEGANNKWDGKLVEAFLKIVQEKPLKTVKK